MVETGVPRSPGTGIGQVGPGAFSWEAGSFPRALEILDADDAIRCVVVTGSEAEPALRRRDPDGGSGRPCVVVPCLRLHDLGLDVARVPLDVSLLNAHARASPLRGDSVRRYNIVGRWRAQHRTGRSLALSGHVDVLEPPSPALWPQPPFPARTEDGAVVGWGGLKGGLVAMLGAVRTMRAAGLEPAADLHVQSVVEEEIGGNGALAATATLEPVDAALVAGCAGDTIATAQMGVLWMAITIDVPPAHASTNDAAESAVTVALALADDLAELTRELGARAPESFRGVADPLAFNLGVIEGETLPSLTPGQCTIRCRIGIFPDDGPEDMRRRVAERVAHFAARNETLRRFPPTVSVDGFAAHGYELDRSSPLLQTCTEVFRRTGTEPRLVTSTTATDTRAFVGSGTPAVCVGPPVENLHSVLERVHDDDLVAAAQRVALFIARWSGARPVTTSSAPLLTHTWKGEVDDLRSKSP